MARWVCVGDLNETNELTWWQMPAWEESLMMDAWMWLAAYEHGGSWDGEND